MIQKYIGGGVSVSRLRLLRSRIRSLPILGGLAGLIGNIQRFVIRRFQIYALPKIKIYEEFEALAPNSSGTPLQRTTLTIQTIHSLFPALNRLANLVPDKILPEILSVADFLELNGYLESQSEELGCLFTAYGSDKANPNDYYKLYAYLLSTLESPQRILEIGLGTNNLSVVSNMGVYGVPGASLRSFRDYLPNALIYGADIDSGVLFEEERISTRWVDQTKVETLDSMFKSFGVTFDLIIDDGLHSPDANISTLVSAIKQTKKGGYVVIEDISKSAREIWMLVQTILSSSNIESRILSGKNADLFLIKVQ
jgi:hypothetical protein